MQSAGRCSRTVLRRAWGNVLRFAINRPATRRTHEGLVQDSVGVICGSHITLAQGAFDVLTCCASHGGARARGAPRTCRPHSPHRRACFAYCLSLQLQPRLFKPAPITTTSPQRKTQHHARQHGGTQPQLCPPHGLHGLQRIQHVQVRELGRRRL
jgi:hypothetical protein